MPPGIVIKWFLAICYKKFRLQAKFDMCVCVCVSGSLFLVLFDSFRIYVFCFSLAGADQCWFFARAFRSALVPSNVWLACA